MLAGDHRLEVLVVHEPRWDLKPAPFGDFSLTRALLLGSPGVLERGLGPVWAAKRVTWRERPEHPGLRSQHFGRNRGSVSGSSAYQTRS